MNRGNSTSLMGYYSLVDWFVLTLAILFFAGLIALNYRFSGSALSPGSIFSITWGMSLIGLFLTGDEYYPLSPEGLLVFALGASFFTMGSLGVLHILRRRQLPYPQTPSPENPAVSVWVNIFLIVLVGGLPFYYELVLSQVGEVDPDMLMFKKRMYDIGNEESKGFDPVNNLPILAFLVASVAVHEGRRTWWLKGRAVFAVLIALTYGAMTGSKASAITVLLTAMFILLNSGRRMKLFVALSIGGVSLVVFSLGLLAVNFVGRTMADPLETVVELVGVVQLYWLGSLVAFDHVVQSVSAMQSGQGIMRPFLLTANSLGARFPIPSLHAEYSPIGGEQITNTYTVYFTYFNDLGWIGMCGMMCLLGGLLAWSYHRSRYGRPIASIFYSMFCTGLVLSVHAEHFVLEFNYYTKTLLFLLFLYGIPWSRLTSDPFARARMESKSWTPDPGRAAPSDR